MYIKIYILNYIYWENLKKLKFGGWHIFSLFSTNSANSNLNPIYHAVSLFELACNDFYVSTYIKLTFCGWCRADESTVGLGSYNVHFGVRVGGVSGDVSWVGQLVSHIMYIYMYGLVWCKVYRVGSVSGTSPYNVR